MSDATEELSKEFRDNFSEFYKNRSRMHDAETALGQGSQAVQSFLLAEWDEWALRNRGIQTVGFEKLNEMAHAHLQIEILYVEAGGNPENLVIDSKKRISGKEFLKLSEALSSRINLGTNLSSDEDVALEQEGFTFAQKQNFLKSFESLFRTIPQHPNFLSADSEELTAVKEWAATPSHVDKNSPDEVPAEIKKFLVEEFQKGFIDLVSIDLTVKNSGLARLYATAERNMKVENLLRSSGISDEEITAIKEQAHDSISGKAFLYNNFADLLPAFAAAKEDYKAKAKAKEALKTKVDDGDDSIPVPMWKKRLEERGEETVRGAGGIGTALF